MSRAIAPKKVLALCALYSLDASNDGKLYLVAKTRQKAKGFSICGSTGRAGDLNCFARYTAVAAVIVVNEWMSYKRRGIMFSCEQRTMLSCACNEWRENPFKSPETVPRISRAHVL